MPTDASSIIRYYPNSCVPAAARRARRGAEIVAWNVLTAANSGELTCASCEKRKCDTCVARLSTFAAIIDGVLLRERVPETSLQVKAGAFRWEFSECRMKWKVVSRDVHLLY